ncbi:MAG: lipoyl(octanoyl) transferase LipB [Bacteroidales bacterium]|nr:lipoyl(octanoyl) transferase LipB [Lentimicrobiaceae bacterium]MDD5694424.1 lipoyl(octanoyl) transferase LipB [Bacteroidales bacterium]
MNTTVKYTDLGLIPFQEAWNFQEKLFQEIIRRKTGQVSAPEESFPVSGHLLFCEHPHVYTLGKSGAERNLLITEKMMQKKGISFFRINRGGDITYHGPGQLVGYPILDLDVFHLTIRRYIHLLEEAVIRTLDSFGVNGERLEGATGVWLEPHTYPRKICAIGVRASRNVTMHGFAFNINTDLSFFQFINPCGFTTKGSTSLQAETHLAGEMAQVKKILLSHLAALIGFTPVA